MLNHASAHLILTHTVRKRVAYHQRKLSLLQYALLFKKYNNLSSFFMEKILKQKKKTKSLIRLTVNSVKLCKHLTSHIRVFNDDDILQGFCFQKELKINTVEISSSCFCMYTISLKKNMRFIWKDQIQRRFYNV